MAQDSNYAQLLRPIGQMLEGLGIESFTLKVESDDFLVQGRKREEPRTLAPEKPLQVVWRLLRRKAPEPEETPDPSSSLVELRYTREEIARMDSAGQSRRSGPGTSPEPHAVSQILRAVGAFIDQKDGQLLGIRKDEQNITIEYRSALNANVSQEFTIASLYDFWVRMYLRRKRAE
jgi:hypothetical protein